MTPDERQMLRNGALQFGVGLSEEDVDRFASFTAELLRWNAKLNLTALTRTGDIIAKHYLDSLSVSGLIPSGAKVLDLGSGGGFPCIPLKIARPDLTVVSVDAVLKKINFQRHVGRLLGLENFSALHSRIEELDPAVTGRFDFVVARAVADLLVLARLGVRFLEREGKLVAMKGNRWREELAEAADGLAELGLVVAETLELRLPPVNDVRGIILVGRKNGDPA